MWMAAIRCYLTHLLKQFQLWWHLLSVEPSLPARCAFRRRRVSCRAAAFRGAWRWSCAQRPWNLLRQVTNVTSPARWLSCLMCPSSPHQVCCYTWPRRDVLPARAGSCCPDSCFTGRVACRNRLPGDRDRGLRNWRHPGTARPWSPGALL